jgi:putative membrane protein
MDRNANDRPMPAIKRKPGLFVLVALLVPDAVYAHAGEAPELHDVLGTWEFDPITIVLLALSALLYFQGTHRLRDRSTEPAGLRPWNIHCYWVGLISLAIALISPIHTAGSILFAAHMTQHEILMLVSAPLLVLGRPLVPYLWGLPPAWRRSLGAVANSRVWIRFWRGITKPLVAFLIHSVTVWVWHAPALFQFAVKNEAMHALQHITFLGSALLFYWSILQSATQRRYSEAVFYLFLIATHTGILGALITFSSHVWYPIYAVRTLTLGLTPLEDQQLGGLIMWVPAGALYTIAGIWCGVKWLNRDEKNVYPVSMIRT